MADNTGHYTAVVQIIHTEPKREPTNPRSSMPVESGERKKRDVANFTVRSDSIDDLTTQVQGHLALVKDYR